MSAPHILIVDNHSREGWTWADVLRRAGFRIGVAADVDMGWYALDGDEYSLLIAIHSPPQCCGLDLLRKVRAAPDRLPCILLAENCASDVGEIMRLLQPGALMEKPVRIPRLLATVRTLLHGTIEQRVVPHAGRAFS
jgi:DNA-binding response OmpR family regulator